MCWSWPNDKKANPQQRINNVNDRQWLLPNWSFLTRWGTRWWHTTYIIVDTECISEYVYLRTHTNIAWIYTSDRPSGGGMTIWRKKLATIENCSATSSTPANNKQNAAADTNDGQTEPQSSPVVSVQQIQFTFYWSSSIVPCFLVVVVNNAIITTSQPSRQLQRQHKKRKTKIPEWNTNKETYDLRSILQISSDFILKTNTIQQNKEMLSMLLVVAL